MCIVFEITRQIESKIVQGSKIEDSTFLMTVSYKAFSSGDIPLLTWPFMTLKMTSDTDASSLKPRYLMPCLQPVSSHSRSYS